MATRGQTAQLKGAFLNLFSVHGNVSWACGELGIKRRQVYDWRDRDESFAQAFSQAEIDATENMEREAYRRAVDGVEKGVYYKGDRIATEHEYSDTLLIFMLKARAPEKYRENLKVDHSGSADVTITYVNDWRNQGAPQE